MRKFTLLIASLFITVGAMAQISTTKEYYIKNVEQNLYLTVGGTADNSYGEVYGAAKVDGEAKQIFTFTAASSDGKYYVMSDSREYITYTGTGAGWNVNADPSVTNAHELTFETVSENVYRILCYNQAKSGNRYFKFEQVGSTYYPYNDADLAAAATWTLEEYTRPERTEYVHVDGNMASSRKFNSFTLTDGTNSLTVSGIQPTTTSPVYVDRSSEKLETYAGATLKFSAFDWETSWMHAYAYVDYNEDFYFNGSVETVSYNYYSGTDINGNTSSQSDANNNQYDGSYGLPAFTIPSDLPAGEYRMRIKIDWNNLDADYGADDIASIGGCQCDITIVVKTAPANTAVKSELKALLDQIKFFVDNNALGAAAGQYSSTGYSLDEVNGMYTDATNFYNNIDDETSVESIQGYINTINAVLPTFSLNMPVDGQAYTIKAKYNDGSFRYIYDNGTKIQMTATKPTDLSGTFVFRKIDEEGNYALVNNDGQYMVFYADGKNGAGDTSNGLASSFELGEKDAVIKFIDATKCNLTNGTATPAVDFLCCFAMQAYMNGSGMHYMMAGDPDFHNGPSNAFYYSGGNRSSVFMLEEATYANTPKLNSVGTSELLTSELHNKAMGTFSAPFATIVPEGVTAYYATNGSDGYITLNPIAATDAIPANAGVVLVGETSGNVTMRPAASETVATLDGNVLVGSAGAEKVISAGCYVLSAKNGVAGFYETTAGTIAMNKAYIEAPAGQGAVGVRLPGTTGIDEVKGENGNVKVIYDLTGRRIDAITAPGIYIVNGVKRLVK